MISSKRLSKLKKEVYKIKGNPKYIKFIVKAKEGLFLYQWNSNADSHKALYTEINRVVDGLDIYNCDECSINDILIVGDGKSEPVIFLEDFPDDIPDDIKEEFKESYNKNPNNPFSEMTTESLKILSDME